MITQFRAQNFKRLRDVTITLGPLNVIVGRNGVGKSSLLEALELVLLVPEAMHHRASEARARFASGLPGSRSVGANEIELTLCRAQGNEYSIRASNENETGESGFRSVVCIAPARGTDLRMQLQEERLQGSSFSFRRPAATANLVSAEPVFSRPRRQPALRLGSVHTPLDRNAEEGLSGLHFQALRVRTLRTALHGTALAASSTAESDVPQLTNTGAGLAAVLQYLQGTRDGRLERIEQSLARIVPGVKRLRTLPVRMNQRRRVRVAVNGTESWHEEELTVTGARYELEFDGLGWIPADQLSEGTLLTLGLLTVLHNDPPELLLLDDLDKGLHPVAQRELVKLLKELQKERPGLQIVATSHSPYLVDELDAAEVFVAGACHDDPTATQIRRLDQHPDWEGNKDFLGLGEFWTSVGEDWVGADDGTR